MDKKWDSSDRFDTRRCAEPLVSLVFVSSATVIHSLEEVERLVSEYRAWNQTHGISGVLMYWDGNFMECLEGAQSVIEYRLDRIKADRQRSGVIVLFQQEVAQRQFGCWSMAYWAPKMTNHANSPEQPEFKPDQAFLSETASIPKTLLSKFWKSLAIYCKSP